MDNLRIIFNIDCEQTMSITKYSVFDFKIYQLRVMISYYFDRSGMIWKILTKQA